MGLMDKVKHQAEQAVAKAQHGVTQGQAKLDQIQAKRQADALLRDLGAAYYSQQRQGGPDAEVVAALDAVDRHVATHGPIGPSAPAAAGDTWTPPSAPEPPGPQPPGPQPPGSQPSGSQPPGS